MAHATHWLVFETAPEPQELEALIVSRETGVTWVDERTIGWQPGVLLTGPLTETELEGSEGLPEWAGAVYAAATPRERGPAIPPELRIPGSVLTAFPGGEPTGMERHTLETLEALARRLGGGVISETGVLVVPEPRVDLLLFSSTWLPEEELLRVLGAAGGPALEFTPDGGALPGVEVEGYGLVATLPESGVVAVTASAVDVTPIALAGYGWAAGELYVYEFRHYPPQTFEFAGALPLAPEEAQERLDPAAVEVLDVLAGAVLAATGGPSYGHLCDDDGFLVVLP